LYRSVLREAEKKAVPLEILRGPAEWLKEGGVRVDVLYPPKDLPDMGRNENEYSVVLALRYGKGAIILPGDLEKKGLFLLETSGADIRAAVLKVPHHGAESALLDSFLDKVGGRWAVISVGKANKFGHPAGAVLSRLRQKGYRVYRTDLDGAVVIRCYAGWWWTLHTAKRGRS